jgi:hypothetical protein
VRADVPLADAPESARDEGRAMSLEDALDYALGDDD